jgi:nitrite reductase/ring-hydroxylating ferredoxin subunit
VATTYVPVAELGELQENEMKVVKVSGRDVVLTLVGGQPFAFDRTCPHEAAPLDEGMIYRKTVICDDHGYTFDLETGECTSPKDGTMLPLFTVEEHDGKWCIRVES